MGQRRGYKEVLYHTKTRTRFLEVIAEFHDPSGDWITRHWFDSIMKTHDAIEATHGSRKREDNQPAIVHERAVALAPMLLENEIDPRQILIRLLHDMPEDYPKVWPHARIRREYGSRVAQAVLQLTKPDISRFGGSKRLRDREYRRQIEHASLSARKAKLSDRLHNTVTVWSTPLGKAVKKLIETEIFYLPMARHLKFLEQELEEAVEYADRKMEHNRTLKELFL